MHHKKPINSPLWEHNLRQTEQQVVGESGLYSGIIFQLLEEVDGCEPPFLKLQPISGQRTKCKVWFLPQWANFQMASSTSSLYTFVFDICYPSQTSPSCVTGERNSKVLKFRGEGMEQNALVFFMWRPGTGAEFPNSSFDLDFLPPPPTTPLSTHVPTRPWQDQQSHLMLETIKFSFLSNSRTQIWDTLLFLQNKWLNSKHKHITL